MKTATQKINVVKSCPGCRQNKNDNIDNKRQQIKKSRFTLSSKKTTTLYFPYFFLL